MPDPAIKFPTKLPTGPMLVLRRRTVADPAASSRLAAAADETRRSIEAVVSATRAPFSAPTPLPSKEVSTLEQALRQLESKLSERETVLAEMECRLADREREIAEMEALLAAREKVIAATRRATAEARPSPPISADEKAALEALRTELDRRETSLQEVKSTLDERERFIEENESRLFEKIQAQQELEIQLEQKAEDLAVRSAAADEEAAAAIVQPKKTTVSTDPAPKKEWDEFRE